MLGCLLKIAYLCAMTEQQIADKRQFAGEKKPSMKRRKEQHDYHGKRFYMVTLAVEGRWAVLGQLVGPHIVLSPLGQAVSREWAHLSIRFPQVSVIMQQVMPDHFHGILYVQEHTDFHLGEVIKYFKLGCNRELRALVAALATQRTTEGTVTTERATQRTTEGTVTTERALFERRLRSFAAMPSQPEGRAILWEKGYNDKILHNYSTLEKWKAYLRDNPLRLAIRREHPDYFRVRFGITVGSQTYAAIGNRFLLQHPQKVQVQLTRKLTDEQIAAEVDKHLALTRQGDILVSPAISSGEAAVMRAALDARKPLIFLSPWGFNTFSRPGHQYFEACAEGRFLILAPWPHQNERIPLTRQMCLALNAMAAEICAL